MTRAGRARQDLIRSLGPPEGLGCLIGQGEVLTIAATSARVLAWVPWRNYFSGNVASQRWTKFSQDAPVGVKCR
jgi:hypothetical protein